MTEVEWTSDHTKELISRIRVNLPKHDMCRYNTGSDRLDWAMIKFRSYSADECREQWTIVMSKVC